MPLYTYNAACVCWACLAHMSYIMHWTSLNICYLSMSWWWSLSCWSACRKAPMLWSTHRRWFGVWQLSSSLSWFLGDKMWQHLSQPQHTITIKEWKECLCGVEHRMKASLDWNWDLVFGSGLLDLPQDAEVSSVSEIADLEDLDGKRKLDNSRRIECAHEDPFPRAMPCNCSNMVNRPFACYTTTWVCVSHCLHTKRFGYPTCKHAYSSHDTAANVWSLITVDICRRRFI